MTANTGRPGYFGDRVAGRVSRRRHRPLSMGHLLADLPGDDRQLHRPPDSRAHQGVPRQGTGLDQRAVRPGQLGLPGRLRGGALRVRLVHRSLRHQDRLRRVHHALERGRADARARGVGRGLLLGAGVSGLQRRRQLPGGHQSGGAVVSQARAGAGHRASSTRAPTSAPLSPRRSSRPSPSPSAGAGRSSSPASWVFSGCCSGSRSTTSPSGQAASKPEFDYIHSDRDEAAAGGTPIGWRRALGYRQTWGVHRREVPDRSRVVVLPDLAAGLLPADPRAGHQEELDSPRHHLRHRHRAQHRRRMADGRLPESRLDGDPRAQDGHVPVRVVRAAHPVA